MAATRSKDRDPLARYAEKRRFDRTPEPAGAEALRPGWRYSIQKHAARRLHYDLRLELDGVLKSWAITRGPSLDPAQKRLAVRTEDHPLAYAEFEGRIPAGNYGAGTVLVWDRGTWEPVGDPHEGLRDGKLVFRLNGERLAGQWALVRFHGKGEQKRENWLLIKHGDDAADAAADITADNADSVVSHRDVEAVAEAPEAVWTGGRTEPAPQHRGADTSRAHPLPGFVAPALATLVDAVPEGTDWYFEIKFDGYRALAAVSGDGVRILTRSGLDWTDRFPSIAAALARLDFDGALLDGEIVAFDEAGVSDFSRLQRAIKGEQGDLAYFVFDLVEDGGKSLRALPLHARKDRLRALLAEAGRDGPVHFTDHVQGDGGAMLKTLCAKGYEGLIAKRADRPYRSGRGRDWLKIKCNHDQEFVIVGWSPSDKALPFASLLLATRDGGRLVYAGRVGTGFSMSDRDDLRRRLDRLARRTAPVEDAVPGAIARAARWVRPELVAQIGFAEFTRDGHVRHGRFLGLREDKPARAVRRDRPAPAPAGRTDDAMSKPRSARPDVVAGVPLSHPDRVLYAAEGLTKYDLAAYFDRMAEPLLARAANRLTSLVRCPDGADGKCFFQRHGGAGLDDGFHRLAVALKGGRTEDYLYVTDRTGLVAAAQIGALELHIWGSQVDDIERPDRLVFDLDPSGEVGFDAVKVAARDVRDVLDALGLKAFPLLTGGKGIHVVAPLVRDHDWPVIKGFAAALARRLAEEDPDRFIAQMSKAKRKGRIFIDYLRNERGSSAVAPYSPRARPGAPLAWPVDWPDLDDIDSAAAFRLADADPAAATAWADYAGTRQHLGTSALATFGLA